MTPKEGLSTLALWGSLILALDAFFLARCNLPRGTGREAAPFNYEAKALERFGGTGPGLLFQDKDGLPVPLDINAATEEELALLPGIGPTTALKIIETRYENGFFLTKEELVSPFGPLSPTLYWTISCYIR